MTASQEHQFDIVTQYLKDARSNGADTALCQAVDVLADIVADALTPDESEDAVRHGFAQVKSELDKMTEPKLCFLLIKLAPSPGPKSTDAEYRQYLRARSLPIPKEHFRNTFIVPLALITEIHERMKQWNSHRPVEWSFVSADMKGIQP